MSLWWATLIPESSEGIDPYCYDWEMTIIVPVSSKKELAEKINLYFEKNDPYDRIDPLNPDAPDDGKRKPSFVIKIYNAKVGKITDFEITSFCIKKNFMPETEIAYTADTLKKCKCDECRCSTCDKPETCNCDYWDESDEDD